MYHLQLVKSGIYTFEGSINMQVMTKVYIFSQEICYAVTVPRKPRGGKTPCMLAEPFRRITRTEAELFC